MRRSRSFASDLANNPLLTGAVILLTALIGVVVSYNANRGLPYVPTYEIAANVRDAAELTQAGSEVRVGGARVGIVKEIRAIPGVKDRAPFARLTLALDADLEGKVPVDSTVQVRPRGILGAKYVDLVPGKSPRQLVAGGTIPLRHDLPIVEIDEAFAVFGKQTTREIRRTISSLGDSLAGRGSQVNETVAAAAKLVGPLQRVARTLLASQTNLPGFIRSAAAATSALAPIAPQLGTLFDRGSTTLGAVDAAGDSLGRAVEQLPATEVVGTRALTRLEPVLADAAAITRAIRPGTRLLPTATRRLVGAVSEGTPTLRRLPRFADDLGVALSALDHLARNRSFATGVRKLIPITTSLLSALRVLSPAQTQCNVIGLWARNVPGAASDGDADGTWINAHVILDVPQMLQSATPSPDLHVNYYPNENTNECESGNEPFGLGQAIGNPAGLQSKTVDVTAPPAGVRARAARAGLLEPTAGARP